MTDNAEAIETCNIFETLDLPDAANLHRRVLLGHVIRSELTERGLSLQQAAVVLETDHAGVAAIVDNDFDAISLEDLIRFCERLGLTVSLEVRRSGAATAPR